jgi:hypothetical protein
MKKDVSKKPTNSKTKQSLQQRVVHDASSFVVDGDERYHEEDKDGGDAYEGCGE